MSPERRPGRGHRVEFCCGYHAVSQALAQHPHEVLEVFVAQGKRASARLTSLTRACEQAAIPLHAIAPLKLDNLTGIKSHQGIAARRRVDPGRLPLTLAELCRDRLNRDSLILLLDRVQDPHNLGACIRTADAAGVSAVLIPATHTVKLNATVRKVASGAADTTPVITVTNVARALRQLAEAGCRIIGAADDAQISLYDAQITFPLVLALGSEAQGLRYNTRNHCDELVRIPMYGAVASLNLSVAAGVCLYEFTRRRAAC